MPDPAGFKVIERWPDDRLAAAGTRLMKSRLLSALAVEEYDVYYYRRQAPSMYGAAERRLPVLRADDRPVRVALLQLDLAWEDIPANHARAAGKHGRCPL